VGEVIRSHSDAFIIKVSGQRNESGEQHHESEEEEAHDREEDDKVHAEHPVQVHGELPVRVVVHPLPALDPSEPERPATPEQSNDPVALGGATGGFQPVLDSRLFYSRLAPVVAARVAVGLQVPPAETEDDAAGKARALVRFACCCCCCCWDGVVVVDAVAVGTVPEQALDVRLGPLAGRHGAGNVRVPHEHRLAPGRLEPLHCWPVHRVALLRRLDCLREPSHGLFVTRREDSTVSPPTK
jgi:hypothetical protein